MNRNKNKTKASGSRYERAKRLCIESKTLPKEIRYAAKYHDWQVDPINKHFHFHIYSCDFYGSILRITDKITLVVFDIPST